MNPANQRRWICFGARACPEGRTLRQRQLLLATAAAIVLVSPSVEGQTLEAISREISVFNLAQAGPASEAFSREVSLFNLTQPSSSVEAISREVSVFNLAQPGPASEAISREVSIFHLTEPAPPPEAISREVSIFNLSQPSPSAEAISREVSVFNLAQPSPISEALSREVSLFNLAQPGPASESMSREVSVFNLAQPGPASEAISREMSVFNSTNFAPHITEQPHNQTALAGGSASFSVGLVGTPPLSYQWRFNSSNLSGATNATLLLSNLQPAQEGLYRVLISNPFGNTLSRPATLIVAVPPSITRHPQSTNAALGSTVILLVTATGTAPLRYQWRHNATNLSGGTNAILLLTSIQPGQAGNYDVTVSNSVGLSTSSVAVVGVSVNNVPVQLNWIYDQPNGQPRFRLTWTADQDFVIEASTDLLSWLTLMTNAAPLRASEFLDPGTGLHPQRFFRARNWP